MSRRPNRRVRSASGSPEAPPAPAVLTAGRRNLHRVLAVVVVPALLLAAAEVSLRIAGVGHPTSLWVTQSVRGEQRAVDNLFFTWPWFGPRRARQPVPFALQHPKPDGRVRVFVLGASAAQGDPDPAFSMSRVMEVLLDRGWPEVDTEVVNLAMTAINSHVVLPIAQHSLDLEPDLLVVYLGNNEVIGPFGVAEGPRGVSDRVRHALMRTTIGQVIQGLGYRLQARRGGMRDWQGMEDYLEHRVAQGDARLERIYRDFERNVAGILEAAGRAGVPAVLATVAVNLADTPPFASQHRPDLSEDDVERWRALVEEAARLEVGGDLGAALRLLDEAVALDDQHAETAYRRGRVLLGLGRHREARLALAMARDLDTLRFRADSRINGILRNLADRTWPAPVVIADVESAVDAATATGSAGGIHLYEHVHLTPSGNYLAATTILRAAADAGLPHGLSAAGRLPALPSEMETLATLGFSGWSLLQAGDEVLARYRRPPFLGTLEAETREQTLAEQVDRLRVFTRGEGLDQSRRAVEAALRLRPDDWVFHYQLGRMLRTVEPDAAASHLRESIAQRPTFDLARRALGRLLLDQGRATEAVAELGAVAGRHRWSPGAVLDHGIALLRARRLAEAEAVLRRAIVLDPEDPDALYHLALALLATEDDPPPARREEARHLLERVVAEYPDYDDARRVLDTLD